MASISWNVSASGNWTTASNWLDDLGVQRVPLAGDDVTINRAGGAFTVSVSGAQTVNSISMAGDDALSFLNSSLSLTTASSISNLSLAGSGTINTTGDLTLTGTSSMANTSALVGPGKILVSGTLSVGGASEVRTEMQVTGTLNATPGTLFVRGATAKVRVLNNAVLNTNGASFQRPDGGLGVFIESGGTLENTASTTLANGAVFIDSGKLKVSGGQFQFNAATTLNNASFEVAAGTFVIINNNVANAVSGTISSTGTGQIVINGSSSFDLAADTTFNFAADQLQFQNSAAIVGPGTLTNAGDISGSPVIKTKIINTGTFTANGNINFATSTAELRITSGTSFDAAGANLFGVVDAKGLFIEGGGILTGTSGIQVSLPLTVLAGGKLKTTTNASIAINGVATMDSPIFDTSGGNNIFLQGGSSVTFSGTATGTGPAGTVIFGNGVSNVNIAAGGAAFNFPTGQLRFSQATINGPGTLTNTGNISGGPIINTRVLNAGSLTPTGSMSFAGAAGELRVLAGGVLSSTGVNIFGAGKGVFIEAGGVMSGAIAISSPLAILGGTLKSAGSTFQFLGTNASIVGGLLDTSGGGIIVFQQNSVTSLAGTITGVGPANTVIFGNTSATFNVAPQGVNLDLQSGQGTVANAVFTGGPVTVLTDISVPGSPLIQNEWRIPGTFNLIGTNPQPNLDGANGMIRILSGGKFISGANINGQNIFGGNGTPGIIIEKGGLFTRNSFSLFNVTAGVPFNNEGTVEILGGNLSLDGPIVQLTGSPGNTTLTGGTWIHQNSTFIDFDNRSINNIGANATVVVGSGFNRFQPTGGIGGIAGTLRVTQAQLLRITSIVNNTGKIIIEAGSSLEVGSYTQGATGSVEFQIAGTGNSNIGQMIGTGPASLNGTAIVSTVNGFTPATGQTFSLQTFTSRTGTYPTVKGIKIGQTSIFDPVYTNTAFSLNSLVNAANLSIDTVANPPANGTAGQNFAINYTVRNVASNPTTATSWIDTVYLSKDGTLDGSDIVLTQLTHNGALAANGTYTVNTTVPLVGALPGNYRLIVVTDSHGQVADPDRTNNTKASTGSSSLDIPTLTPGVSFNGTISNGQDLWYRVNLPAGATPTFTLTGAVAGVAELYESLGEVPTRGSFDGSAFFPGNTVQRIIGDTTAAATYYILVHGRESAGAGQNFSLLASGVRFDLISSSTSGGANVGNVSTTLKGAQFSPDTTFTLVPSSGPSRAAQSVQFVNSKTATATFNLVGLAAGTYSIVANDPDGNDTLSNAFTVTNGGQVGKLRYTLSSPAIARPPFRGTATTITYTNIGNTDIDAPLFVLLAENARLRLADDLDFIPGTYTLVNGRPLATFELLGVSGGAAGTLSPGEKASINVIFEPIDATPHSKSIFEVIVPDNNSLPLDLSNIKQELQPVGIPNDAWDAIFANFHSGIGSTWGSYKSMLADNANYLGQFGAVSPDVMKLVQFEIEQADVFGEISQRYAQGAVGRGSTTPFSTQLLVDSDGNVNLTEGSGTRAFKLLPSGGFRAFGDDAGTLTKNGAIYTLTEVDGQRTVFLANGRINFIENSAGDRITAAYDGGGRLSSLANNATGLITTFTYNGQGHIATQTDGVGRVMTFGYDPSGEHVTSITTPEGTITYTYITGQGAAREHAIGSITSIDGVTTAFAYDSRGRVISRTIGSGPGAVTRTYAYSGPGKVTVTDAGLNSHQYFQTIGGNIAREIDPLGNLTSFIYDASGAIIGITNPNGITTSIGHNDANVVNAVSNLDRSKIQIGTGGTPLRMTSFTDELGKVTTFQHDAEGNMTGVELPDGSTDTYEYDSLGRVIALTNANGERSTYSYDAAGLLESRQLSDGTSITYSYDSHRNLLTAASNAGTTTYTYDSADRLTSVTYPNGKSLTITYDAFGRRETVSDQSGYVVKYAYDSLGRLDTLRDVANALIVDYDYNTLNQLIKETRGNGSTTDYTYDAVGRTETIIHRDSTLAILAQFAYTYNATNRVKTVTTLAGTTTYTYDLIGQMTSVSLPGGRTIAYSYDAKGNRAVVNDSATGLTNYTTNTGDQYTTAGGATLVYDDAGRLISRTEGGVTTSFSYNAFGKLESVIKPGSVITYEYDALGQRIGKTENGVATDFALDPSGIGVLFGEYSGAINVNYATGHGVTARSTGGNTNYYHFDASGDTSLVSGAGGAALSAYTYLPFGEIATQTGSLAQPFTFDGRFGVQSDGGGLFNMRARTYDASLGRFISRDPLGLLGGDSNLYRFANNDPVNHNDPSGLEDVYGGVSGTLIVGGGVQVGAGGYVNSDDLWDSGLYLSGGGGTGFDVGVSATAGQSSDISGYGGNLNVGAGGGVHTTTYDTEGNVTGFNSGVGLGLQDAASASYTMTKTGKLSLRQIGNKLGFPPPPKVDRRPEVVLGRPLDTYKNKNGASDLFKNLYDTNKQNGLSDQDALLATIAFLKKNNLYDPVYNPNPVVTETQTPEDPNNITGPHGAGADPIPDLIAPGQTRFDGYVSDQSIYDYTIEFENKPTAGVPAQVVHITQTLDSDLDFSTFQFKTFGFGDFVLNLPDDAIGSSFTTIVDVTSTLGVLVKIEGSLNLQTGLLDVTFTSLDPVTNDIPLDPLLGFLPPNVDDPEGDGFLTYFVSPKPGLADGTQFDALATIVFDTEAPINTPFVNNKLDIAPPTSQVSALPATTNTTDFTVSWSGQDGPGSGVFSYDIYVSVNNGAYELWKDHTTDTSDIYTGIVGSTYSFYSVARDNVGQTEAAPASADTSTEIVDGQVQLPEIDVTDNSGTATDKSVTLADTLIGQSSAAKIFTISNTGEEALNITNFVKGGTNPGDFVVTIKDNTGAIVNGSSFSIAAGLSYTVEVVFQPTVSGPRSAEITFNTNDPDDSEGSITLGMDGNGTQPAQPPEIDVTDDSGNAADKSVTLADTQVGQTSAAKVFSISNTGDQVLNITNFAKGGNHPSNFIVTVKNDLGAVVNGTSFSIPAGKTYTITVAFQPSVTGARNANITFNTNDPDDSEGSITLSMSGNGTQVQPPEIDVTDDSGNATDKSVTLADTLVGQSSAAKVFTITNSGGQALNITNFAKSGSNPTNFTVTVKNDLGAVVSSSSFSIPAGKSYTISVVFQPSASGNRSAKVTFNTNDTTGGESAITLNMNGNGLQPQPPEIDVTDDSGNSTDKSVTLPDTQVGQTSAAKVFTIANSGDQTLNITNFAKGGSNAGDFIVTVKNDLGAVVNGSSFSVPAGKSYTVTVVFQPSATGNRSAKITFNTNDPDGGEGSITLNMNGNALQPPPVGTNVYLSDLNPTFAKNGWGNYERDRSNGELSSNDGRTITLNGQTFAKGLGVHADSELRYSLSQAYTRFTAWVGVDDEVAFLGNVVFQVYVDGVKKFDSGTMTGTSNSKFVDVDLTGKKELKLVVQSNGWSLFDHADWADAKLFKPVSHFVSDLNTSSATNGLGAFERDKSNGGSGNNDGGTLTLNGQTFAKGLGVHANSDLRYILDKNFTKFTAKVGVDDEVGSGGSLIFQVFVDGEKKFDSGVMTGTSTTQTVNINLTNKSEIRLVVLSNGSTSNDHGDWADAMFFT